VATSLCNIGGSLYELGRQEEAFEYFSQALKIRQTLYGDKPHPDVVLSLYNMGVTLEKLGRQEEALEHYRNVLAMFQSTYENGDHPNIIRVKQNIQRAEQNQHRGNRMKGFEKLKRRFRKGK